LQPIEHRFAFCVHSIDGILQLRRALFNGRPNLRDVLQAGDTPEIHRDFMKPLCAAMVSSAHRLRGTGHGQQDLLYLGCLLPVVAGRVATPVLNFCLRIFSGGRNGVRRRCRGERFSDGCKCRFERIPLRGTSFDTGTADVSERRAICAEADRKAIAAQMRGAKRRFQSDRSLPASRYLRIEIMALMHVRVQTLNPVIGSNCTRREPWDPSQNRYL